MLLSLFWRGHVYRLDFDPTLARIKSYVRFRTEHQSTLLRRPKIPQLCSFCFTNSVTAPPKLYTALVSGLRSKFNPQVRPCLFFAALSDPENPWPSYRCQIAFC